MSRSAALRSLILSCLVALVPAAAGAYAPRTLDDRPLPQLAAAIPAEASSSIAEADPFAPTTSTPRLALEVPSLSGGRFGAKTGLAIFKYANANPTRYIDPTGYAAFNTHDMAEFIEEVDTYDAEKGTVHKTLSDDQTGSVGRFGFPAGSKFKQSYDALVQQYGSREEALRVLKTMQGRGVGVYAVTITEQSDYTEAGALKQDEVYRQFVREVGSFADEGIGDLRSFFLESIAGARVGEGRNISLEYNAGYATSLAKGREIAEPQMGSIPFYRFYKGNEVLRKLSIEGKLPRDVEQQAIDAHILTAIQVGTLALSAKSALSSLRGGLRGFREGLREASTSAATSTASTRIQTTVGNLRAAELRDAHHIIQDAAVRDLPGYSTELAPGTQLQGPSTARGTPHYQATQVQRQRGGGTYAAERRIAYKALRRAGYSEAEALAEIQRVDDYFQSIGVTPQTQTRMPGNRR